MNLLTKLSLVSNLTLGAFGYWAYHNAWSGAEAWAKVQTEKAQERAMHACDDQKTCLSLWKIAHDLKGYQGPKFNPEDEEATDEAIPAQASELASLAADLSQTAHNTSGHTTADSETDPKHSESSAASHGDSHDSKPAESSASTSHESAHGEKHTSAPATSDEHSAGSHEASDSSEEGHHTEKPEFEYPAWANEVKRLVDIETLWGAEIEVSKAPGAASLFLTGGGCTLLVRQAGRGIQIEISGMRKQ